MAEYINKQALLAEYDRVHVGPPGGARKLIEEAPAEDVVPVVHGRWMAEEQKVWNLEIPVVIGWRCSVCAEEGYIDFDYCPNCGARMKDGE
jgi:hypothetical protein